MTQEALKLALITLEGWDNHDKWVWPQTALEQAKRNTKEAITAIKEALAQPEQPKVRTGDCLLVGVCASEGHKIAPQRSESSGKPSAWVGLTDEDKHEIELRAGITEDDDGYIVSQVFKLTEAKLKELNT